jgi:hypothetical protein
MRIRDPGWKKVGPGIRDKHPGSATLVFIKRQLNQDLDMMSLVIVLQHVF